MHHRTSLISVASFRLQSMLFPNCLRVHFCASLHLSLVRKHLPPSVGEHCASPLWMTLGFQPPGYLSSDCEELNVRGMLHFPNLMSLRHRWLASQTDSLKCTLVLLLKIRSARSDIPVCYKH